MSDERPAVRHRANEAAGGPFPPLNVLDLVRRGLKPAASMFIGGKSDPRYSDLPAIALSRVMLGRDKLGNLVLEESGEGARRMVYVGHEQERVDRLRDIEEIFTRQQVRPTLPPAKIRPLQDEFGQLMGYPPCCTRAFAEAPQLARLGDMYASMARLGWTMRPVDPRLNHVVAYLYGFAFLLHVPCSDTCEATLALVERVLAEAYPPWARLVIEDVLGHGAVVFADDRIALFRNEGPLEGGALAVSSFNGEPHPEALAAPRQPDRCVPRDAGGFPDEAVTGLLVSEGGLEARVDGEWRPLAPTGVSRLKPPLVLVTRGAAG